MLVGNREIWLPIPNFEGLYEVSNLGRVKRLHSKTTRILVPYITRRGYGRVVLSKNGKPHKWLVHRLVATVFVSNPDNKPQVNHIDGNKHNNTANNLEWVTQIENQLHAVRTGLQPVFYNDPAHCKPVEMLAVDGALEEIFPSAAEAERQTGVNSSHITRCCKGRGKTAGGFAWKYHKEVAELGR